MKDPPRKNLMQKLPLWLRSIVFLLVLVLVYQPVQQLVIHPFVSEVIVAERMIDDHAGFDVLIMSSSHGYCAFDPRILQDTLADSRAYSISIPNLSFAHIALLLQQMETEGKLPEVLVLELFSIASKMENTTQTAFFNAWSHTWQPVYLAQIAQYYSPTFLPYPLIPLVNQHENWKLPDMLADNVGYFNNKQQLAEHEITSHFGYRRSGFRPIATVMTVGEYQESFANPEALLPTDANLVGLQKILELCAAHDIQVILVTAPYPAGTHADFAQVEASLATFGLENHNFNQLYGDDFTRLQYLDANHVNANGAVEASLLLAQIIAQETGRSYLPEGAIPYQALILNEIAVEASGEMTLLTLQPAVENTDWVVDWAALDTEGNLLAAQSQGGMRWSIPTNLLALAGQTVQVTLWLPELDYTVTLNLTLGE